MHSRLTCCTNSCHGSRWDEVGRSHLIKNGSLKQQVGRGGTVPPHKSGGLSKQVGRGGTVPPQQKCWFEGGTVPPHKNWGLGSRWDEVGCEVGWPHPIKTGDLAAGGTRWDGRWDGPTP